MCIIKTSLLRFGELALNHAPRICIKFLREKLDYCYSLGICTGRETNVMAIALESEIVY